MSAWDLGVLRAVRFKLLASPDAVAEGAGLDIEDAAQALEALGRAGLATSTPRGWRLSAEGQAVLDNLLNEERRAIDGDGARQVHQRFLAVDAELKQLVTDHQMSGDTSVSAANVSRLAQVHAAAADIATDAVSLAPRLATYPGRLTQALARVEMGDARFLASPMVDSYHTVWFELHEELIHLAGLRRADLEAEGRS